MHESVLLKESVDGLNIKPNGIYVDATLGYGGHSTEIHKRIKEGQLIAFDQDRDAIDHCKELFKDAPNVTIVHSNFSRLKEELESRNITLVDGIIFDLGLSSPEIDNDARGFSFMKDAILDMRMDQSKDFSALNVVNEYPIHKLVDVFYQYGEESFSKSIAKKIIDNRPINRTLELVEVIKKAIPAFARRQGGHPAKKVFQALRIEVNDELRVFEESLADALMMLNPGGRIVVITFHSLEDRICKKTFKDKVEVKTLRGLPIKESEITKEFKLINNKVIQASEEELSVNNRAHSAKLRIIEKL